MFAQGLSSIGTCHRTIPPAETAVGIGGHHLPHSPDGEAVIACPAARPVCGRERLYPFLSCFCFSELDTVSGSFSAFRTFFFTLSAASRGDLTPSIVRIMGTLLEVPFSKE